MKKLSILFLAIIAFSCQEKNSSNTPQLTATTQNIEDGTEAYISVLGKEGRPEPIDTVSIKGNKFTIDLPEVDFQTLNFLSLENTQGNMLFINENKDLTITVYKDSLRASKIKGGENNQVFNEYIAVLDESSKKMRALSQKYSNPGMLKDPKIMKEARAEQTKIQEESMEKRREVINNNPESLVSILALSDMLNSKSIPNTEMKDLYASLDEKVQNTHLGKQIGDALTKASATAVGSKAPGFSGPNPEGEELALKDLMGKVTVIDFWASWCKPCRAENPNIVKMYKKYQDKGLKMVGVSLDKNNAKDKWIKAIKDDGLTWPQISHLQYWKGPIADKYGIRSIPATYILDENGIIVAKDLRGDALENKVKELLEKA